MQIDPPTKIVIKESPLHGIGIFSTQPIYSGEIIETCTFLKFPHSKEENLPFFENYSFCYPRDEDWQTHALVLGYGSLYNHSVFPNAEWRTEDEKYIFYAIKDIKEGEEILINYSNGSRFD